MGRPTIAVCSFMERVVLEYPRRVVERVKAEKDAKADEGLDFARRKSIARKIGAGYMVLSRFKKISRALITINQIE